MVRPVLGLLATPLLVLAILVSSSACGTLANFGGRPGDPSKNHQPIPYGGVLGDVEHLVENNRDEDLLVALPIASVDICLCLVADTLTLPIVIFQNWQAAIKRHEQSRPKEVDPTTLEPVKLSAGAIDSVEAKK